MHDPPLNQADVFGEPDALWSYATDGQAPFGVGASAALANWIGRVVYGYAAIEFQFFINFAMCSTEHSKLLYQRFYSARQINHKEDLAIKAAGWLPEELQEANKKLWRHLRAAANRRAQFAHSTIFRDDRGYVSVFPGKTSVRYTRLEQNLFIKTISQFRNLQTDAHMLFVCLRLFDPSQAEKRLSELPLPQGAYASAANKDDPGPLPPHVIVARNAALKRLGLDQLLFVESPLYPRPNETPFRYNGHLTLWANGR